MSENDEVLKYPTDVSSIDDAHAVIKWAGIESTEYTDCAILYEVTFDQLRLMYDMGRQKESKLRAIDRTEIERLKVIDRRTADSNREFCEQLYIANGEIERLKNELYEQKERTSQERIKGVTELAQKDAEIAQLKLRLENSRPYQNNLAPECNGVPLMQGKDY